MKHNFNKKIINYIKTEHWKHKVSIAHLARKLNIPKGSIYFLVNKYKINHRNTIESNNILQSKIIKKNILIKLYINNHLSIKNIANKFNLSTATVFNYLKKYNIKTKPKHKSYKVWTTKPEWKKLKDKCAKERAKRMKGHIPWNRGLDKSDPRVMRTSEGLVKAHQEGKYPKGEFHFRFGKQLSKEHRVKLSLSHGGTGRPEDKRNYPYEFSERLKEQIRKRDGYKCQVCGLSQDNQYRKLDVHHIDYNKQNCDKNNLVSLCHDCHIKTNTNRKYWKNYFKKEEVLI